MGEVDVTNAQNRPDAKSFRDGALYTEHDCPIGNQPIPPLNGPDGLLRWRPICRLLIDSDSPEAQRGTFMATLVYCLPRGPGPHEIVPEHLGALVAAVDRGEPIALHGTHDAALTDAIDAILAMAGGGRV